MLSHVNFGMGGIFISCIFLYIVHSSPFLCVCGDDRITCWREQMISQVGQEMLRGGVQGRPGF